MEDLKLEVAYRFNPLFEVLTNQLNNIDNSNGSNDLKYGALVFFIRNVKGVVKRKNLTFSFKRDIQKLCKKHNLNFDVLWNDKVDWSGKKPGYQGGTNLRKMYNI